MLDHQREAQIFDEAIQIIFFRDVIAFCKSNSISFSIALHFFARLIIEITIRTGKRHVQFFHGLDHIQARIILI